MSNLSQKGPEWAGMAKIVLQLYTRPDAEPFREPVDWKSLGLLDYPQMIKKPMDLGQVRRNIELGTHYSTIYQAADDVRLIWDNCMRYNADGSEFFVLAQTMDKRFEDRFSRLLKEHNMSSSSSSSNNNAITSADSKSKQQHQQHQHFTGQPPTLDEKRTFARTLYKITKEELGKVILDLDAKSPSALSKNSADDEVEINVDLISPPVFYELMSFVKTCAGATTAADGGPPGGGRKKKNNKKSRIS